MRIRKETSGLDVFGRGGLGRVKRRAYQYKQAALESASTINT
jgi:hypothetical protein